MNRLTIANFVVLVIADRTGLTVTSSIWEATMARPVGVGSFGDGWLAGYSAV